MKSLKGSKTNCEGKLIWSCIAYLKRCHMAAIFLVSILFVVLNTPVTALALNVTSADFLAENTQIIEQCDSTGKAAVKVLGQIKLSTDVEAKQVMVTAFNGFKSFTGKLTNKGIYCVGIEDSTPATYITLVVSAPKITPQIKNIRLFFKPSGQGAPVMAGPDFEAVPSDKPDQGYLVTMAYMKISGGRPVYNHGIKDFVPSLKFTLNGDEGKTMQTNKNGNAVIALDPGKYRILTEKNVLTEVEIKPGETTITPLYSGGRTIF